MIYAEGVGM